MLMLISFFFNPPFSKCHPCAISSMSDAPKNCIFNLILPPELYLDILQSLQSLCIQMELIVFPLHTTSSSSYFMFILVSFGYHNKILQTGWFKQQEFYFLPFWRV